jgi:hypothetical protein
MLAEAAHSAADTLNQAFLLASLRPDPGIARLTARSASGPLTVRPSAVRSSAVGHFVRGRSRASWWTMLLIQ